MKLNPVKPRKALNKAWLKTEINQMVYALYGLTEEEVKVVEGV